MIDTVVPVTSTRVAEMVKLLENTFRAVNIGLVNELALMCHRMDIDVWEVIEAAKTKPFGFMPFYPGPGLGGHCIPIDPFYLSWKARQSGFEARFIELAGNVNGAMPEYVVERIAEALNSAKKAVNGSRVHVFGVAYKRDVNDMRESPALDIMELLSAPRRDGQLHRSVRARRSSTARSSSSRSTRPRAADGVRLRAHHHRSQGVRLRAHREAVPAGRRHAQRAEGDREREDLPVCNSELDTKHTEARRPRKAH